jgi:hypothetical protein
LSSVFHGTRHYISTSVTKPISNLNALNNRSGARIPTENHNLFRNSHYTARRYRACPQLTYPSGENRFTSASYCLSYVMPDSIRSLQNLQKESCGILTLL